MREVLDILKIDKNSTDSYCFMCQFGGLRAVFGEAKPPVATGLDVYLIVFRKYCKCSFSSAGLTIVANVAIATGPAIFCSKSYLLHYI